MAADFEDLFDFELLRGPWEAIVPGTGSLVRKNRLPLEDGEEEMGFKREATEIMSL